MESTEPIYTEKQTLIINEEGYKYLTSIAKWGKFLAIVGFIGIGIMVLFSFAMIMSGTFINNIPMYQNLPFNMSLFMGIFYFIIGAIYFIPCYYLFIFSVKTQHGLQNSDQFDIDLGLKNLKSVFKFMGIMTIISLVFCALAFFVGILIALFSI